MVMRSTHHKTVLKSLLYGLIILFSTISSVAIAANITVSSSRNPVALDDSFHLIYEADSSVDGSPNFNPIYQYFDVLSSSQSTNMRSVNGSWNLKKTWDLSVIAKKVGSVTIPAISFGKDFSPSIRITVKNSTSQNNQATVPAKIFLESRVDKKQGWVQSQFIYTIRLLRTVSIAGASISDPTTNDPDAIIHQLSEDKYQTTRNGLRHEVFERRYAIFPQKSGTITINPVSFEGRVNATQPRSIFDQFRISGQLKRLRSKAITINVKAAPASINLQDWLPASKVTIVDEWSDDLQNIKAGEPITRTITIAVEGLTAVQLPDLNFEEVKNLKQYPDKSITENKQGPHGITGFKQIKVAYIPASAGLYTLPEIKLQWWNTITNKTEVAKIPAVTITATGIIETQQLATPVMVEPQQNEQTKDNKITETAVNQQAVDQPYWKWLSFCLAFAWLVTLILLFKKSKSSNAINNVHSTSSLKATSSQVIRYAKSNNATKVKTALIEWARLCYHDENLTNLSQITEYCSAQLTTEIRQLNNALYNTEKEVWQGKDLLIKFKDELMIAYKKPDSPEPALKPLYKN